MAFTPWAVPRRSSRGADRESGYAVKLMVSESESDAGPNAAAIVDSSFARGHRPALNRHAQICLAVAPAVLLLLFHAMRYYPFLTDDALISLRYADRLVDGHGLTWTDGDRVEGYSNLTWVLANALLHLFGVDLIVACRLLGGVCLVGTLWCVIAWEAAEAERALWAGALAASAAALTGACAVWLIGGLEQPLVVLLLALALCTCRGALTGRTESLRWPALSLALLCLSRPDGVLLAASVVVAFGVARGLAPTDSLRVRARLRESIRAGARLGWPSASAVAGQLAFRLSYYHDWVPNTARAKLSLSNERLTEGAAYLQHGAEFLWPLVALAVLSTLLGRSLSRPLLLVWLPLITWTIYVAFIGGDFFPGRRLLVPVVVLLAFVIASGIAGILASSPRPLLALAPCAVLLLLQIPLTWLDPENTHALVVAPWAANDRVVGRLLKKAFAKDQPLLAVDGAGALPFFSELPSVDMLGLNDRYLASNPPADFGTRMVGHELGDAAYIARRKPDLIAMCLSGEPPAACFRSDRELLQRADFQRDYLPIRFRGLDPYPHESKLFVRREGRVGMRSRGSELRVPGFLLAANKGVAVLDAQGRLGAELPANTTATLLLPRDCSRCNVQVESTPAVAAQVTSPRTLSVVTTVPAHVLSVLLTQP